MELKKMVLGFSVVLLSTPLAFAKTPYDNVLHKLIPPSVSYNVKVEKQSKLKGFDQLNISLVNKKTGTVFHRYLWISKDKKEIIPVLLTYKNGKIQRVEPKTIITRTPVNISWFYNLINQLPKSIIKSYGKGKDVYMFSDPLCPFCKRQLPQLVKLAQENKIRLHILPLNIHGEIAKKASAIFLNIEEKEGLKAAIDKVEGASFEKVEKLVKNNKNMEKLLKKYSPIMDKILNTAIEHGINGTPAMIIPTSKDKGYLILGLGDITPYLKK